MTDPTPDDLHEQFIRLFASCEGRVRVVLRALLPSLNALDDVMQETALVAWRKFRAFEAGTSFFAWMVTIGRFEALRWRRDHAAARLVFCDQVADLLADEAIAESEEHAARQKALPYTIGLWDKTAPVEVELKSGKNVLKFYGPARVTVGQFTLTPPK